VLSAGQSLAVTFTGTGPVRRDRRRFLTWIGVIVLVASLILALVGCSRA